MMMDLDERIANMGNSPSPLDSDKRDTIWDRTPLLRPSFAVRRRRRLVGPVLIAAAIAVVGVGVAGASGNLFQGGGEPVADHIAALDGPAARVTPMPEYFDQSSGTQMPDRMRSRLESLVKMNDARVDDALRFGNLLPQSDSRLLLDHHEDGFDVQLFAVPTDRNRLCYMYDGSVGGGSCVSTFSVDRPTIHWFSAGAGRPTVVLGLAADEVKFVRIHFDDRVEDALMGTNAFVWRSEDDDVVPTDIEAVLHSGASIHMKATDIVGMAADRAAPINPEP